MHEKQSITFENFIQEYTTSSKIQSECLNAFGKLQKFCATEGYFDLAVDEVDFWKKIKSNSDYEYKIFNIDTFILKVVFNSKKFKILFEALVNDCNRLLEYDNISINITQIIDIFITEIKKITNHLSFSNITSTEAKKEDRLKTMRHNIKNNYQSLENYYPIIEENSLSFKGEIYKEFCEIIENWFFKDNLEKVNDYFSLSAIDKKIVRFYLLNKEFEFLSEESLPILLKEIRRKEKFLRDECNLKVIEKTIYRIKKLWTESF